MGDERRKRVDSPNVSPTAAVVAKAIRARVVADWKFIAKKEERAARERDALAALSRRERNWAGIPAVTLPNRGRKGHLLGVASLAREAGDGSQKAYY
jgi:hypothetical protein